MVAKFTRFVELALALCLYRQIEIGQFARQRIRRFRSGGGQGRTAFADRAVEFAKAA